MKNIWITSDTHYDHKNIVRGVSSWEDKEISCRDFKTLEEYNEAIVNNINKIVAQDDILYHLGDWAMGGEESIYNFRKRIVCREIILIRGNHDKHIKVSNFWKGIGASTNFSLVTDTLEVSHGKTKFFMSHYSHQVWPKSHRGVLHLFGHSHDSIKGVGKSMDVGLDAAKRILGEYRPFSVEEVISILSKKEVSYLDHHKER